MLHNNFCLALWRLPAASPAASSAASSTSASASASASAPVLPHYKSYLENIVAASLTAAPGIPAATSASSQPSQPGPTPISADADAVLLAFTYPRYRIYSIARSPDGRFVAVGQSLFCLLLLCSAQGAGLCSVDPAPSI